MWIRSLYVSAHPGRTTREKVCSGNIVEQIIRPTGLLDPVVDIRPARHQVDELLFEIRQRVRLKERVLVTTLTKKSAEDLTSYLSGVGCQVRYLHSEIKTMERNEIIRDLRLGLFDVLVGINLLREGLDLPEVSLVVVTDADKEGFLRSERSLIQTIGRAARNSKGKVILFGDRVTSSMKKAIDETNRRRQIQMEYNKKHKITPKSIIKKVSESLEKAGGDSKKSPLTGKPVSPAEDSKELTREIKTLKRKMKKASDRLEFEEAAQLRDQIKRLELLQLTVLEAKNG